jgi:hypothetical protein
VSPGGLSASTILFVLLFPPFVAGGFLVAIHR